MTTKQMNDLVDCYLDSKGLSNPSIRKRAARKVLGYMDTTGAFLSGGQLALPSDKGVVVSAYKRHKGSALNGAEKSVINHIYELAGSSVGKSASRHAVTPKATKSVVTAPKAVNRLAAAEKNCCRESLFPSALCLVRWFLMCRGCIASSSVKVSAYRQSMGRSVRMASSISARHPLPSESVSGNRN